MNNPYAAPQTPMTIDATGNLASRGQRFGASLLDGVVLAPLNFILTKALITEPSPEAIQEAMRRGGTAEVIELSTASYSTGTLLTINLVVLLAFVAINFVLLKKGQTIGKKLVKIQIQHRDTGGLLPVKDLITKRIAPLYLGSAVLSAIHPMLGVLVLVDILCIFRSGHNTLHDDLAHTKVVKL